MTQIAAVFLLLFLSVTGASAATTSTAVLAGGCFWCMEPPFEKLRGVTSVESGYAGGTKETAKYEQVSAGTTAHLEVVRITYDPSIISYSDLLEVFWRQIDPTDDGGSFVDRGAQYKSAIFYASESEKKAAEKSKAALASSGRFKRPIVTSIKPLANFYLAEDYHQDYHLKNPLRYKIYRFNSGRDQYLDKTWGSEREVKRLLAKP